VTQFLISIYSNTFTHISLKNGKLSFKEEERREVEALMSVGASVFCRDQFFILFHST